MSSSPTVDVPPGDIQIDADTRLARYLTRRDVNATYLAWQLEQFTPYLGRRILEVGCGIGGIIEQLRPRELICGLDVDPDVLACAAARFADRPECRFKLLDLAGSADSEVDELRQFRFDTIVCFNTLEHIVDERSVLERMREIVEPDGVVALLVPAHPSLFGNYDRLDGHVRRYSARHLRHTAEAAGFEVVRLRHFNAIGAIGWWIQYRLLNRRQHGPGHFRVMSRLVIMCRFAERIVPPPFGLSLVAVLRKQELRS